MKIFFIKSFMQIKKNKEPCGTPAKTDDHDEH